jgi:hypothetical protein
MRKASFLYIYSGMPRYTQILTKNPGTYPSKFNPDGYSSGLPLRYVSGYLMPNTVQNVHRIGEWGGPVVPRLPIRPFGQLAHFFPALRQYRPVDQLVPN